MVEETVFKTEEDISRTAAAEKIRRIADTLEEGEVSLSSGEKQVQLLPPEEVELEVKVEEDEDKGEVSLEVEIEWSASEDKGLSIG